MRLKEDMPAYSRFSLAISAEKVYGPQGSLLQPLLQPSLLDPWPLPLVFFLGECQCLALCICSPPPSPPPLLVTSTHARKNERDESMRDMLLLLLPCTHRTKLMLRCVADFSNKLLILCIAAISRASSSPMTTSPLTVSPPSPLAASPPSMPSPPFLSCLLLAAGPENVQPLSSDEVQGV